MMRGISKWIAAPESIMTNHCSALQTAFTLSGSALNFFFEVCGRIVTSVVRRKQLFIQPDNSKLIFKFLKTFSVSNSSLCYTDDETLFEYCTVVGEVETFGRTYLR